ncbi:MAG TPA: hypothetical protein VHC22_01900 [Pirellulales bacterium]|nr:hypothetical protein [Pirellulales bacterium]
MRRKMLAARTLAITVTVFLGLASSGRFRADEIVPADAQPRWWKGNLHTHTLWSDGDDLPEMVAEWYRTHGYHFLALSDHNVLAQGMRWMKEAEIKKRGGEGVVDKYLQRFGRSWVETRGEGNEREVRLKPLDEFRALVEERGRFLMIPAEEISDKAQNVPVHINASNVKESLPPLGGQTVREAIENNLRNVEDQSRRAGREILAHLNHPNFGWAITAEDLAHVVMERHFEVYNGHPGVNQLGDKDHPSVERLWDIANTIRLGHLKSPPLYGIATDDSHHYHDKVNGARPGRGWLMVRATHLTPEHIVKAIKAGNCHASSGVLLKEVRYDRERRKLELEIEPAGSARFVTQFIGTLRGVNPTADGGAESSGTASAPRSGEPPRVTRRYSGQIGQVLKSVEGLMPTYQLTGDELYVRAVVISSEPPHNPSFRGQKQQAWTQPVGWE